MTIALYKPFGVLSQFTPEPTSPYQTLAEFDMPGGVYPVGRLDADSEGLLILTDEAKLVGKLLPPDEEHPRTYWVQVEGNPTDDAIAQLERGVEIGGYRTLPCKVSRIEPEPKVPPRIPPIRVRRTIPTTWLLITLVEGKNRQVRKMTARVGHPTLRLIRSNIGALGLFDLGLTVGQWRILSAYERSLLRSKAAIAHNGESKAEDHGDNTYPHK